MATHSKKGKKKPQYLVDHTGLAGTPEDWEDEFDFGSPLGLHYETLYDENETQAGALINEATGKPYKNDHSIRSGLIHRHVDIESLPEDNADVLGELYDNSDPMEALLNKSAEDLTQADIDAMVKALESEKAESKARHPSSHKM